MYVYIFYLVVLSKHGCPLMQTMVTQLSKEQIQSQ